MSWLGKLVGGTIGFAMGGPLGAIAGAAIGHAFDTSEQQEIYLEHRPSSGEEAQMTFFVAAFSMLGKLAKADGYVSRQEIESIETFMARDLNLNPESRRFAVEIFQAALNSPSSFQDFALQFHQQFRTQPQMLELMIDILLRVSVADGPVRDMEENLILFAVRTFQLSDGEYRKIKSRYVRTSDRYYDILGCSVSDADETIRSKYRKLVKDYHPDRIASKGLPEEFTRFAQEKFRQIQEAYDMIRKERGIN